MRAVHIAGLGCALIACLAWVGGGSPGPTAAVLAPTESAPVVAGRRPPTEPEMTPAAFREGRQRNAADFPAVPLPDREGVVRGWVHDENGSAVDSAELTAVREGVAVELDSSDGSFAAHGAAGDFTLLARAEGFLPERLEGLSLASGEEVREVVVTLRRGLPVEGRVLSDDGPVIGAHVTVEVEGFLRSVYSDEEGRFALAGLPPGAAMVRVYDESAGTAEV